MKRIDTHEQTGAQGAANETTNQPGDAGAETTNQPAETGDVETGDHTTDEALSNVQATEALAEAAGATPPKKGRFDFDPGKVASTRRGAKIRSNIYYEVMGVPGSNTKMQPQKALCLQLVNANTSDEQPRISEPDLKAIVEAAKADGTLETKQDAWRIFAYYKGQLVEEGYLAEINEKSAPKPVAKAS